MLTVIGKLLADRRCPRRAGEIDLHNARTHERKASIRRAPTRQREREIHEIMLSVVPGGGGRDADNTGRSKARVCRRKDHGIVRFIYNLKRELVGIGSE